MLVVNFGYFSQQGLDPRGGADAVGRPLVQLLADGKFWTLFSVLFGLGFALQMKRADARGARFAPFYVRRLLILLVIGLSHALLHPLEILHRYALLGFLLLPLCRASTRVLVAVGVLGLLAPPLIQGLAPGEPAAAADSALVYSEAGLPELLSHNFTRFRRGAIDIRVLAPFPYFVLGFYLGRQRGLASMAGHRAQIARARWWLLGLGLGLQAAILALLVAASAMVPAPVRPLIPTLLDLGSAMLGLGYACVILVMLDDAQWRHRFSGLAAVGRMALSNYLLQTVVVTTLLYNYGAGLYGRLGIVSGLPLVALIFTGQVLLSRWWMARFRFGPVEWLWRSVAYGRLQPLRVEGHIASAMR